MNRRSFTALASFLGRHRVLYAVLAAVLLLSAVLEGFTAASLYPFVSAVMGQGTDGRGGPILDVLNQVVAMVPVQDKILAATLLLLSVVVLKGATVLIREALVAYGGGRIVHEAKLAYLSRLAQAPYTYFLQARDGDLSYRLSTAAQNLGNALLLLPYAAMQIFTIAAIVVLLASIDWRLTVGVAASGLAIYAMIRFVSLKVSYAIGKQRGEAMATELGVAMEFVRGIREISTAHAAPFWTGRFQAESDRIRRLYLREMVWQSMPGVLIETSFFLGLALLVILYRGGTEDSLGGILPMMVVYAYALYRLVGGISIFSRYKLRISSYLPDVELLHDSIGDTPQQPPDTGREDLTMKRSIIFDQVSFVYPGRQEPAVREIGFEVKKGVATAIIGASGAGKSTIVNLLTRLFEPMGGHILVDGEELTRFHRDAWLRRIGYVGQETFIFNGTVEDNIRFGILDVARAEVEAVAVAAQAHEFIQKMPQGYGTMVGERGTSLSGGQRQRIAIARALLRKPEILIFDEATSQLDAASEALIQKAIAALARDHTVILVAHRLSTVRCATHIIVLDRGRVLEQGSHEELLARKGQYSVMMASSRD